MSDEPSAAPDAPPPPPPHWAPPPPPPLYGQPQYEQPQYGQTVYLQARPTNGFAIASMVLGILWIYWLGSLLAVIFGHIALHQFKQNPNQNGRGMALAGVILGWAGLGLFVIVMLALVARG